MHEHRKLPVRILLYKVEGIGHRIKAPVVEGIAPHDPQCRQTGAFDKAMPSICLDCIGRA